jgi:hypothetical protein
MTARLTQTQQIDVAMAREMLDADAEGGPAAVVASTYATSGSPPGLDVADPYPYAYGTARNHVAALLAVVDELAAKPEAGA